MARGVIKKWVQERGFGFIRPENGGEDIFFHFSALREGDQIREGALVIYETGTDKKTGKTKALNVNLS